MSRAAALAVALLLPLVARAQSSPDAGAGADARRRPTRAPAATPPALAGAAPHAGAARRRRASFEPPRALSDTDRPAAAQRAADHEPVVVTVKLLVDVDGRRAEGRARHARRSRRSTTRSIAAAKAFTFAARRATAASRCRSRSRSRTRSCRRRRRRRRAPAVDDRARRARRCCAASWSSSARARRSPSATVTAVVGDRHYAVDADPRGQLPAARCRPAPRRSSVYAPGHNPFVQQETLARQAGARGHVPRRARSLRPLRDRRRRRAAPRGGLAHHAARRRDQADPRHVRRSVPRDPDAARRRVGRVAAAVPGRARRQPELDRLPARRHARAAALSPAVGTERHPPRVHRRDPVLSRAARPRPTAATPAASSTAARRARARDEHLLDFDANLLQAGGLVREPIKPLGATVTAAARYGYPGLPARPRDQPGSRCRTGTTSCASTAATPRNGWTVFAFGAHDELDTRRARPPTRTIPNPPLDAVADPGLPPPRPALPPDAAAGSTRRTALVAGYDHTFSAGTDFTVWLAEPSAALALDADRRRSTLDAGRRRRSCATSSRARSRSARPSALSAITAQLDSSTVGSAYVEALWRPTPRWLIRPGVRADVYRRRHHHEVRRRSAPHRALQARPIATCPTSPPDSDDSAIWLKGSAGIYHQPPRFVLPLPGLDMMPLKYGLLQLVPDQPRRRDPARSSASSSRSRASSTTWTRRSSICRSTPRRSSPRANSDAAPDDDRHAADRRRRCSSIASRTPQTGPRLRPRGPAAPPGEDAASSAGSRTRCRARSATARRRAGVPYDFDRTHLLNVVAGLPLRRNWDLGVRLQYQSGKPATTTAGYNTARTAGYVRFDVRVDKRAVYRKLAARLLRRHHQRRAAARRGHAGHGDPLRAADRRPARPVLTGDAMNNGNTIDSQLLDLMLRAGSRWVLWLLLGLSSRRSRSMLERIWFFSRSGSPREQLDAALAALRDKGAASALAKLAGRAVDGGGGRARVPRRTPTTAPPPSRSTRRPRSSRSACATRSGSRSSARSATTRRSSACSAPCSASSARSTISPATRCRARRP